MGTGSIGLGKVGAEAFAPPGVEALPGRDGSARPADRSQTPRIAFFFNAQPHQLLHGITTAEELALGWRAEVDILSSTQVNLDLARATVLPDSRRRLHFEQVGSPLVRALSARMGRIVPPKLLTLLAIRRRMNGYDAIALPERTSIMLRSLGVTRPRFIHIDHGAGDRAAGFDPRIARFDYALMAGEKQRRRMLVEGLVREEASAVVGYPKSTPPTGCATGAGRPSRSSGRSSSTTRISRRRSARGAITASSWSGGSSRRIATI
ncbi:hypothetical protein ACFSTI_28315 [Rhizorhabdus histidinilytica]